MTDISGITKNLSDYIATSQTLNLSTEVHWHAKHHILDTFAAMISGSTLQAGLTIFRYVQLERGIPEAQVVASSVVTSAGLAAMANGTLAHADETDDSHAASGTHPGCAVVPAALAFAERENCSGLAFLRAVVAGYDVACRVGRALAPRLLAERGHSSRSIGGAFGAAAAAASLAGLEPEGVRCALSFAAQQASGIGSYIRAENHGEKAVVLGGIPARNGVAAATLVKAGFTGAADPFEGESNFLAAYSPDPRPGEIMRGLGTDFEITRTSIKRFCVGSPIQAPLEALLQMISEYKLHADNVRHLKVRLPQDKAGTVNDRFMPDVNVQHILAVALLNGKLTFAAAHSAESMTDSAVLGLKSRIELVPDPELVDKDYPRQVILEVSTPDGSRLIKHLRSYRGTPENPPSAQEVEDKARELVGPVIGAKNSERLITAIAELENLKSARDLRPFLAVERR